KAALRGLFHPVQLVVDAIKRPGNGIYQGNPHDQLFGDRSHDLSIEGGGDALGDGMSEALGVILV
ncbi:hypothetical protein OR606_22995, partial [Aeromonas hydrophila]|uniref:hypothetical protein n=1 Tax=Aeromonas hydrophila TaxID=644 RepID=UPI00225631DB